MLRLVRTAFLLLFRSALDLNEIIDWIRQMFSYYGSKNKIAKYYPKPLHNLIIEPFAGAAWYSYLYRDRQVILNEKYEIIYNIWNWLINRASEEEILLNRDFYCGEDTRDLTLCKEHKDLIGFNINYGSELPNRKVQKKLCGTKDKPNWASTTHFRLTDTANKLKEIRHWQVKFGDYLSLENVTATWFIDPPYQFGGHRYVENKIDYCKLREFCLSRRGQVIVCENSKADWLDFSSLIENSGQKHKTTEYIYYIECAA